LPLGSLFTLATSLKIAEVAQFVLIFFAVKNMYLCNSDKIYFWVHMYWAFFSKKSSVHPAFDGKDELIELQSLFANFLISTSNQFAFSQQNPMYSIIVFRIFDLDFA
jgi:hypothetical protein